MDYKKAIEEMYDIREKKEKNPAPPEGDSRGQELEEDKPNKIIQCAASATWFIIWLIKIGDMKKNKDPITEKVTSFVLL